MSLRSFLDRFVHPWVAAVALAGVVLWLTAFVVAGTGVVLRSLGSNPYLVFELFLGGGILGMVGMVVLAACGLWLVGVRTIQVLGVS